jgi:hypothetical protein
MAEARTNYYRAAEQHGREEHPIDEAVARRLRHGALRQRTRRATDELVEALGEKRHQWLALETLLGDYRIDREEAFFNIGYEHGLVAGRAEALAASLRRRSGQHRALATRLAQLAVNAGLRPPGPVAALLEVAWGLTLGPRQPQDRPRTRRNRRSR